MDTSKRLLALDIFRGITIAGMILVNNPGSWGHIYAPLEHAEWHGSTPTDWVFPFFLFIVGVAIPLALGRRKVEGADQRALLLKIGQRVLSIFAIGLLLHLIPRFDFVHMRIPGVLQRIAIVYGICAVIFLKTQWKTQLWIGIGLLLFYWILMTLVPVPGGFPPNLEPDTNLGAWLDRTIFTSNHLWSQSKTWDPEGLLSTLPAVVTGIIGMLTGQWLKTQRNDYEKLTGLLAVGTCLLALGLAWNPLFPINKKLWTSSYVLYVGGLALLFLGVVYWLVDVLGYKRWTKPFVVYGTNALAAYVFSGLIAKTMGLISWTGADGDPITLKGWLYGALYEPFFSPINASLAYAITNVAVCLGLVWIMYSRKIFWRV